MTQCIDQFHKDEFITKKQQQQYHYFLFVFDTFIFYFLFHLHCQRLQAFQNAQVKAPKIISKRSKSSASERLAT